MRQNINNSNKNRLIIQGESCCHVGRSARRIEVGDVIHPLGMIQTPKISLSASVLYILQLVRRVPLGWSHVEHVEGTYVHSGAQMMCIWSSVQSRSPQVNGCEAPVSGGHAGASPSVCSLWQICSVTSELITAGEGRRCGRKRVRDYAHPLPLLSPLIEGCDRFVHSSTPV